VNAVQYALTDHEDREHDNADSDADVWMRIHLAASPPALPDRGLEFIKKQLHFLKTRDCQSVAGFCLNE